MKKLILILIVSCITSISFAQIGSVTFTNKISSKSSTAKIGQYVKVYDKNEIAHKGRLNAYIQDGIQYLKVGKDVLQLNNTQEYKIYNKGTRIAGQIVRFTGDGVALWGTLVVIGGMTSNDTEGWGKLIAVIGVVYGVIPGLAIAGLGKLIASIGPTYHISNCEVTLNPALQTSDIKNSPTTGISDSTQVIKSN